MELQWPLILFTAFVAWSCGLFAVQGLMALKGESSKTQMPALIGTVVLMAIGGIAVFTHLQHWERIFNGFGHITSGITQELICIVLLIVVAVLFFVNLRKDAEKIPSWVAILAIAVSVITVCITAHSYMMAARPAWNSILWIACLLGNACVLGPATFAVLDAKVNKSEGEKVQLSQMLFIGAIAGAALMLVYVFSLALVGSSFEPVNYYLDPTNPMRQMVNPADAANLFAPSYAALLWLGIVIVGAALPIVAAFMAKRKPVDSEILKYAAIALAAAFVGAICVRVLFFLMGAAVLIIY